MATHSPDMVTEELAGLWGSYSLPELIRGSRETDDYLNNNGKAAFDLNNPAFASTQPNFKIDSSMTTNMATSALVAANGSFGSHQALEVDLPTLDSDLIRHLYPDTLDCTLPTTTTNAPTMIKQEQPTSAFAATPAPTFMPPISDMHQPVDVDYYEPVVSFDMRPSVGEGIADIRESLLRSQNHGAMNNASTTGLASNNRLLHQQQQGGVNASIPPLQQQQQPPLTQQQIAQKQARAAAMASIPATTQPISAKQALALHTYDSLPFNADDDEMFPVLPNMDPELGQPTGERWLEFSLQAAIHEADLDEALLMTIQPPELPQSTTTPATSGTSGSQKVGAGLGGEGSGAGGSSCEPAALGVKEEDGANNYDNKQPQQQQKYRRQAAALLEYDEQEDDEEDEGEEERQMGSEDDDDDDDDEDFGSGHASKKKKGGRRSGGSGGEQKGKRGSGGGGGPTRSRSGKNKTQDQVQRNRDAQKRFREKQKLLRKELELKVELMNEQLNEVHRQQEAEKRHGELLAKMIAVKEDQMAMLYNNTKALDNPDALQADVPVDPMRLELMYKLSVPGAFSLDTLLRFAPAGCQTHLADDGRAKGPPPLTHLVLEWNRFVLSAKKVLDAAAQAAYVPARLRHKSGFSHPAAAVLWTHEKAPFSKVAERLLSEPGFTEEVVVQSAGVSYKFTNQALQELTSMLHRIGTLNWELVTLFPETMLQLASTKATTGQYAPAERLESLDRWRSVLRALGLRREQLENIVKAHQKFAAEMAPVKKERPAIVRKLEIAAASADLATLDECTSALSENSRKEFYAWAELAGRIRGTLDFPVQQARLFTLSWPYWPQQNILGTAAALELGLTPTWIEAVKNGRASGGISAKDRDDLMHQEDSF